MHGTKIKFLQSKFRGKKNSGIMNPEKLKGVDKQQEHKNNKTLMSKITVIQRVKPT